MSEHAFGNPTQVLALFEKPLLAADCHNSELRELNQSPLSIQIPSDIMMLITG